MRADYVRSSLSSNIGTRMSDPKAKPYSEIRNWTNISSLTVTIEGATVGPGKTYRGEAPRTLIRSGILRPTPPKLKAKK